MAILIILRLLLVRIIILFVTILQDFRTSAIDILLSMIELLFSSLAILLLTTTVLIILTRILHRVANTVGQTFWLSGELVDLVLVLITGPIKLWVVSEEALNLVELAYHGDFHNFTCKRWGYTHTNDHDYVKQTAKIAQECQHIVVFTFEIMVLAVWSEVNRKVFPLRNG